MPVLPARGRLSSVNQDFLELLEQRFQIGEKFARSYVEYFERAQAVTLTTEADWMGLPATQRMWFDYAISTNLRGRDLIASIEPHHSFAASRYLDIGCGFGGSLVAASEKGATAMGLEIDSVRIGFARTNLEDFGMNAPVLNQDALDPALSKRIGRFDIITCNDVAEHVASAQQLFENLASLLHPPGVAYLEIPNRYSVESVASDGHFGLFGITLLPREAAKAYHYEQFRYEYDVGDYWELEEYLAFFERAGLKGTLVASLYHPVRELSELDALLDGLERARWQCRASEEMRSSLEEAYGAYRERLRSDRRTLAEEKFRNRYLRNFWTFLVRHDE